MSHTLHVSAYPTRSCISTVSDQWRHCLMETFTFPVCTSLSDDFQISISPTAINIVLTCLTYYSALVNWDIIADWSISIEFKPINTRIIATKNVAATKPRQGGLPFESSNCHCYALDRSVLFFIQNVISVQPLQLLRRMQNHVMIELAMNIPIYATLDIFHGISWIESVKNTSI